MSQLSPEQIGGIVAGSFLVLGVFTKALSRSELSWDDLHMGVEASLTTVSGAMVYGFELFNQAKNVPQGSAEFMAIYDQQQWNQLWLVLSMVVLFATATTHMHAEKNLKNRWGIRFAFLQAANIFGIATLFGFIFFVKHAA